MTSEHLEIERKYDAAADLPWVDLSSLPGVGSLADPAVKHLDATYFDTASLALTRAGITLRRRTGGSDAGWHLKVPAAAGARTEFGEPLKGHETPPAALLDRVRVHVRDHDLHPVARLESRRTVHRLLDPNGTVLAEAVDDVVRASATGPDGSADVSDWREWEVELVDGSDALMDAADAVIRAAGATASRWPSKLARALHGRLASRPAAPEFAGLSPKSPARDVVLAHLAEQVGVIVARDPLVRTDEPDAVHKMRVATRRLRSALATFRPLLDRTVTDSLRDELKWIAGELGGARDAEVLRERLLAEIAAEPDELVLGPIASRIGTDLQLQHKKAHDELLVALDSDRYFRLLDRLDESIADPPFTKAADRKAGKVLTVCVRKAYRRVTRLVQAGEPADHAHRDEWYHEIRKAAKRLRYAGESVAPAFGEPALVLAARAEALQEALGEHQDSVVARAALRELGVRLHLDGDNAFTLGRLHALEQVRGEKALGEFAQDWTALAAPATTAWLRG
ncbi:MAG TPA: CYTH and CHAD domain-containing protein [Nakamurella multipartita]|nr:CYTH and CHAD domain-containing protein [Nakamurella multipartita]